MPTVDFSPNFRSHVPVEPQTVSGSTLREVLEEVFARHPRLRGYVLDDQGALRKHVAVVVDGAAARDRTALADPVGEESEIFVLQALSGG
jgi:sulfur carrier protein ThiS